MARNLTSVAGVTQARAALEDLGRRLHEAADQAAEAAAEDAAEQMRQDVPVDKGEARDSIEVTKVGEGVYEVGPHTDHDVFIEFGTTDMDAQPFVGPAGETQRTEFPKTAAEKLKQAAE